MKSRYNYILVAVILLGLISALWLNWERHKVEQKNNSVSLAMEYEGLLKLAALEGKPSEEVLLKFKEAGINSLMIFDTTLERLTKKGEIQSATGGELRRATTLGADKGVFKAIAENDLQENAAYIAAGSNQAVLDDIFEDLILRYGEDRVSEVSTSPRILRIEGSTDILPEDKYDEPLGIMQAPLGLPIADMQYVHRLGFNVIVRPQNYTNVDEKKLDAVFARIKKSGVPVSSYMPCGRETIGYPAKLDYMGKLLQDNNMNLIMLEHYTQLRFAQIDGLVELAENNQYNASRSYVIDPLEQKKISVETALHRWALTDEERNIRVNYIRPFLMPIKGKDILQINLQYVKDIKNNVEERGFTIGKPGVFATTNKGESKTEYAPYFPNKLALVPIILAIIAGAVMYASLLFNINNKQQLLLWLVAALVSVSIFMLGRGLLLRQILALTAASIFPVLSMNVIFNIWDKCKESSSSLLKIIFNAIWQLALAIALSLVGAAFLSAILADSRFLLEIDIYRGVKLTFILPVLLTAVLYLKRYDMLQVVGKGLNTLLVRLNSLLNTGLTFKHVALLLVLLFVAFYFVGRSGHTGGVPVPAIELKMRAFLEQVMYARPREKEFMIGHPFFFLAVFATYRNMPRWWQFTLVCGAVIGQGSLVQTFCHMRTPVIMSFIRALDGYAVGVVFGIIAVIGAVCLLSVIKRLKRRYLKQ